MRFTKMQGIGNDYIYLDCTGGSPEDLPALAARLSRLHFGVGSDGLICIFPSDAADFKMRMFNADGSEGEMCGNGLRCVCKFVYDKGLTGKTALAVETLAGIKRCTLRVEGDKVSTVTVDMGAPAVGEPFLLTVPDGTYLVTPVSVGNPHIVTFVDDVDGLNLPALGPGFEHHPRFAPNRVNTEFVEVTAPGRLKMRVWERGSGETLACGTGACAALAAAAVSGRCGREAVVSLRGGELNIRWDEGNGHIYMTGPAVTVFEGEMNE
ncbi:MAG TPA: diaminopimelate epimerase [Pseudoflavonifractor sp.]|nr:diaminopimelate epimerase [Pseudoflavonifractor sp.]